MNTTNSILMSQLLTGLPQILAYLAGLIVAIIHLPRYRRACVFIIVGSGILLLTTVATPLIQQQIFAQVNSSRSSSQEYANYMRFIGITSSTWFLSSLSVSSNL